MSEEIRIVQPDNPLAVMSLFDADAKTLDGFIDYVADTIESGMDDPLKVLAMSKKMEYVVKRINERIKEATERELAKHGEKANLFSCEMAYVPTYTKYDFSNDRKWEELNKAIKEREEFLKALKMPVTVVDDETGEIITVRPPIKKSTMGLRVTVICLVIFCLLRSSYALGLPEFDGANFFKVSESTIGHIKDGSTWAHIKTTVK